MGKLHVFKIRVAPADETTESVLYSETKMTATVWNLYMEYSAKIPNVNPRDFVKALQTTRRYNWLWSMDFANLLTTLKFAQLSSREYIKMLKFPSDHFPWIYVNNPILRDGSTILQMPSVGTFEIKSFRNTKFTKTLRFDVKSWNCCMHDICTSRIYQVYIFRDSIRNSPDWYLGFRAWEEKSDKDRSHKVISMIPHITTDEATGFDKVTLRLLDDSGSSDIIAASDLFSDDLSDSELEQNIYDTFYPHGISRNAAEYRLWDKSFDVDQPVYNTKRFTTKFVEFCDLYGLRAYKAKGYVGQYCMMPDCINGIIQEYVDYNEVMYRCTKCGELGSKYVVTLPFMMKSPRKDFIKLTQDEYRNMLLYGFIHPDNFNYEFGMHKKPSKMK